MKRKVDESLTPNVFETLNEDVARGIASHSSVNHIVNLMSVCKTTYNLFKPNLALVLAPKAQTCVVQGNPEGLALIAKHKPEALFEKGRVIDLCGRIFPSISAYQLTIFLCDEDMKKTIDPFIPEELREKRQEQYAELGSGGADLIKLDFDPLKAAEKDFNTILTFTGLWTNFDLNGPGPVQIEVCPKSRPVSGCMRKRKIMASGKKRTIIIAQLLEKPRAKKCGYYNAFVRKAAHSTHCLPVLTISSGE